VNLVHANSPGYMARADIYVYSNPKTFLAHYLQGFMA
jgi:hypothetical protein